MPVSLTLLQREMYTEAGAARLLRLSPATLHYWLEGGERRGKKYKPVIREEATGSRNVTWADLARIATMEEGKPFAEGRQLLHDAQADAGLSSDWALVAPNGDQLSLLPPAQAFVDRVQWDHDVASAWRPDSDLDSLVIVDPDVRFGRPSVGGVSTETLAEQADAGVEELAEMFDLTAQQVRWALSYELAEQAA